MSSLILTKINKNNSNT